MRRAGRRPGLPTARVTATAAFLLTAAEDNAILRFTVTYRGQLLEVEIGLEKVEYALREGECLVIRHETEEVELTPENPLAVRTVSRR